MARIFLFYFMILLSGKSRARERASRKSSKMLQQLSVIRYTHGLRRCHSKGVAELSALGSTHQSVVANPKPRF